MYLLLIMRVYKYRKNKLPTTNLIMYILAIFPDMLGDEITEILINTYQRVVK
jgi:hypothetical protein